MSPAGHNAMGSAFSRSVSHLVGSGRDCVIASLPGFDLGPPSCSCRARAAMPTRRISIHRTSAITGGERVERMPLPARITELQDHAVGALVRTVKGTTNGMPAVRWLSVRQLRPDRGRRRAGVDLRPVRRQAGGDGRAAPASSTGCRPRRPPTGTCGSTSWPTPGTASTPPSPPPAAWPGCPGWTSPPAATIRRRRRSPAGRRRPTCWCSAATRSTRSPRRRPTRNASTRCCARPPGWPGSGTARRWSRCPATTTGTTGWPRSGATSASPG